MEILYYVSLLLILWFRLGKDVKKKDCQNNKNSYKLCGT